MGEVKRKQDASSSDASSSRSKTKNSPRDEVNNDHQEEEQMETNDESENLNDENVVVYMSHFQNAQAHSALVRYGLIIVMVGLIGIYLAANIGSGVSADYMLVRDGVVIEQRKLLSASIIRSVKELWINHTYPLAVFIAITSVAWPYIKVLLSIYAWVMPYRNPRCREVLLEVIDALVKWSFVDIVVLVEIMVAFRSTIALAPTVSLEIVVVPKWGFYVYIVANMISLLSTHIIVHNHRKIHYHGGNYHHDHIEQQDNKADTIEEAAHDDPTSTTSPIVAGSLQSRGNLSPTFLAVAALGMVISLGMYLLGCFANVFQIENSRGDTVSDVHQYSLWSLGTSVPSSQVAESTESRVGTVFIQVMWYVLCLAMPVLCTLVFGILYLVPCCSNAKVVERLFYAGEILFAWSCAEVFLVSTIFSVWQMATFGDGLIQADCTACFVVRTKILLPGFVFLCVGALLNVAVNVLLFRTAHRILYRS